MQHVHGRLEKIQETRREARLFCPTCSSKLGHPMFVDGDANAAANIILLVGTLPPDRVHCPVAVA